MATTDKESSAAGTDNRPPMLEESDFESWKIRIERYIRGKPLGKLIWKSIKNGPSPHPMITVTTGEGEQQTQVTREKTDEEFTEAENNKERADIQATNILSQGLPRHIFNTLNQTETAKEIWENVELLMQGSGLTEQQKKETLFDQYERFWANGNESIHDYFVQFHKLINDMKITKIEILNSKDISIVSYVDLYTHLKSYEQHALKTLSKMNQTSGNADPLAYIAKATQSTSSPSQYVPLPPQYSSAPQQAPQSTNDAMLATMNPILNLLTGQITTESVQRRAPGNKGKHAATGSQGKVVTCYNCLGQGHMAKECKEKKRAKDSQWFKDKALLMEAKEKGAILDAEAEAFLADVECTASYAEPLAITTTTAFEVSHEDAYDSDVDEAPHAAAAFMANLMQTEGHIKTNEEQSFANDSLKPELERYKIQVQNLEQSKVKNDLEQLVFERNKRNADLEEQLMSLKQQLLQHVESNKSLKTESEKLKADKNALKESYLEELVWLRNTNKVVMELLQSYGQPVQTVPMLSKRPTFSTKDLHKSALGHRNPLYLKSAQLCRPALMKDSLCKVSSKPINYAKLNSMYDTFVPQKQLSREQVYWLPANEVASYNCNQTKPVTNFVRTRPAKSQVYTQLKMLKACFPELTRFVKRQNDTPYITNLGVCILTFEHTKKCFVEEIIPFYEKLKTHVKGIEDNLFKEVSEYMKIFDELDKEYDQCVIDKKSLEIENKNLLIQNECLLAESVSKDICSVVLTSDIVVPMSVEPRSNCVKEHSRNLELEAEILKMKQLLVEKEKRCSFIETKYQELELKFQKYKECFENPQVCNNSSSPELNVFFEINKLKDQLQGKDELIRKLKAQIGNMKEVSADSNLSTLEFQALETKNTQLKEELTVVRIKNDSLRDENVSIKKCYQDLYQSKAESNSNISSRAAVPEKPKVLAPSLYAMTSKYIPP
ncbi:putative ribonuclease H-like domain-containing protein [Tanacetum coccineum]